jgi:hypothetical protein
MYEDLIIHNELICSHKFNKSKSSVFRPLNGALYFYIVLMMFFVVLTVAGLFFVDDSGIPFLKGLKTGGIFTLTNVVTN